MRLSNVRGLAVSGTSPLRGEVKSGCVNLIEKTLKRQSCPLVSMPKAMRLIEVSLERSSSADVQGNAMGPTPQHFGVPQFQGDYVKTLLLQKFYESRLISSDHDQIRIDAECIHVDPVTPNAFR